MRRAKKGLAILASTVLMVTSAVNYHGLTFSVNVYSEETSNEETVSESGAEEAVAQVLTEAQAEVAAEAPVAEVQEAAAQDTPANAEVPEQSAAQEVTMETVAAETTMPENGMETIETVEAETATTAVNTVAENDIVTETEATTVSEESKETSEFDNAIKFDENETEAEDKTEEEYEVETEEYETETEYEIGDFEGKWDDEGIMVTSLLPLDEITVYLVLEDKTENEIKNMSIDEVLNSLQDSDGNKVSIPEDATTAWRYVKDETDGIETYEEYPLGQGATIDMSAEDDSIVKYNMELIVGSRSQLDTNNKRYLITVYLPGELMDEYSYELYQQDELGVRTKVNPTKSSQLVTSGDVAIVTCVVIEGHVEGTEYYLGLHSEIAGHPDIQTEVYTDAEWEKYEAGLEAISCTAEILNQDMTKKDSGLKGVYDFSAATSSEEDLKKNTFHVIKTDRKTGNVISSTKLAYVILVNAYVLEGKLLAYNSQSNNMVDATCYKSMFTKRFMKYHSSTEVNGTTVMVGTSFDITILAYMLKEEYLAEDELYFALVKPEVEIEGGLLKAVEGVYASLEDALNEPDIKEQLYVSDFGNGQVGYKGTYKKLKFFTLFFASGKVSNIGVIVTTYDSKFDLNYIRSYTDAPIIGESDPWFQITGVMQNDIEVPSFIVQNGSNMNLDTMYGYGYQTVLIQDENVDLSQLQPVFWTADTEHVTDVRINGQPVTSGSVIDCSTGIVQYTVVIDGHQKNYQVNFVKSSPEAKLFVAGPQTQEVFLDEYTEYKHDILIANMGQKELTGLRIELNATNCKLDDYWTVGGENNSTLAPFDSTTTDTEYGVLGNLAKVRLLPLNDEGGEIEGTLTVYADGQEPIVINLTGRAQNPKIVTDQEKFDQVTAVKYVPYSYMITTNNMYDWNEVTYTLTGKLPEGVEWYPETGEIYGVPQEVGTFPITVEAAFKSDTYTFESSKVDLVLTVLDNSNENVYNASDDGYSIKQALGTDAGDYNFVLTSLEDAVFVSYGEFSEFNNEYCGVWLNGQKLEEGKDYDAESGSTRITIHGETFENTDYVNQDGENTIALEFRKDGNRNEELKRTSQNFTINTTKPTETEPTVAPTTAPKPTVTPTTAEPTKPTTAPTTAEPTKPTTTPTKPTVEPTKPTAEESTTAKATTAEEPTKEESTTAKPSETSGTESNSETSSNKETSTGSKSDETKKPNETKSAASSTDTPETASTAKENETNASSTETTAASVTCTVKMVDAENKAIDNLNIELHSTPQKAITDENGCAAFDSIEFGSHTLYVKNADGTTEDSISFTIAEGKALALNGNVITAPNGADFILLVRYDQNKLEFVSVHNNDSTSLSVILGIEDYAEWIGAFLFGIGIAMAMCLCAYAISSAARRRK